MPIIFRTLAVLSVVTFSPTLVAAQASRDGRLGLIPEHTPSYTFNPSLLTPPQAKFRDYRVEGAIGGAAAFLGIVILASPGPNGDSAHPNILGGILALGVFAGIGGLIGSLFPKGS